MQKYSQKSVHYKGYELCFYYKDDNGIETLDGLYRWEANDNYIRKLFEVENEKEASRITDNKKLIRQYVGY